MDGVPDSFCQLTPDARRPLEQIIERFEQAWQGGQRPDLENFLPPFGPQRRLLLVELVHIDIEFRVRAGEAAALADYLERYPELGGTVRLVLEVLEGPYRGRCFEFEEHATFLVGRSKTAHLCLRDDPYFSRHHFLLELNPPTCYLRDLGSRNGTLLNGVPVSQGFLKDGDVISGGRTRLRLTLQQFAPPTAAPVSEQTIDMPAAREERPREPDDLPRHIPGYEMLRKLGQGGMGVVYLARHASSGAQVALKLIMPESAGSERLVQMFLREVSILSQLDHPRIVRFHEIGFARGEFFFAMDYVEALALADLLGPLDMAGRVKVACGILCQAAEALGHAHARGFVHRDIKPANLLVRRAGKKLRVKLADFGLAKNFEKSGLSGMTRSGEVRGSLPYMAPEQLLDCKSVQPAADIYSAGATLYQLLSGQTPHDFPRGQDPFRVLLEESPVPLGQRCPALPAAMAELVHRAMARDPAERFASAAELRARLLPFARGEGTMS